MGDDVLPGGADVRDGVVLTAAEDVHGVLVQAEGLVDAHLVDDVPAGLEILDVTSPCTYTGQQVTCVAGTVGPGQTVTYKIKVKGCKMPRNSGSR